MGNEKQIKTECGGVLGVFFAIFVASNSNSTVARGNFLANTIFLYFLYDLFSALAARDFLCTYKLAFTIGIWF
jgi:hypothetical protein